MQRQPYTEFGLVFEFNSATKFGRGNMVLIFYFLFFILFYFILFYFFFFWGGGGGVGYEFSSGAFWIYFLSI